MEQSFWFELVLCYEKVLIFAAFTYSSIVCIGAAQENEASNHRSMKSGERDENASQCSVELDLNPALSPAFQTSRVCSGTDSKTSHSKVKSERRPHQHQKSKDPLKKSIRFRNGLSKKIIKQNRIDKSKYSRDVKGSQIKLPRKHADFPEHASENANAQPAGNVKTPPAGNMKTPPPAHERTPPSNREEGDQPKQQQQQSEPSENNHNQKNAEGAEGSSDNEKPGKTEADIIQGVRDMMATAKQRKETTKNKKNEASKIAAAATKNQNKRWKIFKK